MDTFYRGNSRLALTSRTGGSKITGEVALTNRNGGSFYSGLSNGKGMPVRVGGDEFMVLMREDRKEKVEQYIRTLIDRISVFNANNILPYRINFSYGLTVFDNTYNTVDEMIQHSDRRMYEDKQNKEMENY